MKTSLRHGNIYFHLVFSFSGSCEISDSLEISALAFTFFTLMQTEIQLHYRKPKQSVSLFVRNLANHSMLYIRYLFQ